MSPGPGSPDEEVSSGPPSIPTQSQSFGPRSSLLFARRSIVKRLIEARKTYDRPQEELADLWGQRAFKSALQAWLHIFDTSQIGYIDRKAFEAGLDRLDSSEGRDASMHLWHQLDEDASGELTFEDFAVSAEEVAAWSSFRRWCGPRFQHAKDMVRQLKFVYARALGLDPDPSDDTIRETEFIEALRAFGWDGGFEKTFFHAFDLEGKDCIVPSYLKFLEFEVKRYRQTAASRRKAERTLSQKVKEKQACQLSIRSFKEFLRRQFGHLFRAWRQALDLDGSMTLPRAELMKAIRNLNWKGDYRALWKALDHDNSGVTTLEELDPYCAHHLAHFKAWASDVCTSLQPSALFELLDSKKRKKLSYAQFADECEARGYTRNPKHLANLLDWEGKRFVQESDLEFLKSWRVPAWLTSNPSPSAAAQFRKCLLARYGHVLKAWCTALDQDGSNSCNWHEFQEAVKNVHFHGDLAGAWLALDQDYDNSISLKELDEDVYNTLVVFKNWADCEFGSVKSAFQVLDRDNSGALTYKEFKSSLRSFHFPGDQRAVFSILDQHNDGMLKTKDVVFLDSWTDAEVNEDTSAFAKAAKKQELAADQLLEYFSISPGPGAYNVPSTFAVNDRCPTSRHGGAFSFTSRAKTPKTSRAVGPAKYCPSLEFTRSRKPAWSFGGTTSPGPRSNSVETRTPSRASKTTSRPGSRLEERRAATPGPGAYDLVGKHHCEGPMFSMRPRRALPLHPLQRHAGR